VPEKIQTLWDRPRQEALDWLVEHDRFWIGKVFPEHLSDEFRGVIADGLNRGLGRQDIGRRLRDVVMGRPGVPAKQEFYRRIAATSVNRARNWGAVFSLEEAGFTEYEIRAVMDERTSAICRFMNGKVFRVRDAMDTVQRALSGPPSAIERIAPWPRYDAKRGDHYLTAGGSRHYLSGKSSRWLSDRGLSLPPYHGNCRTIYLVTRRQFEEHREVVEPAAPPFDVSELEPVRMRLDGMHEKQVFRDKEGSRWLFKPVGRGEEFRAWGDRAAVELAERLGLPTPEVYVTEIGGRTGSLQRMFDAAGNFRGVNPTALTAEELAAIQREHVFDWLISNHDGHAGKFLRLADGRTVAIDKGQLYRFFGKDKLDVGYVPNPERSLYSEVFGAYARGEDVKLLPPSHREIEGLLKRIEALPDEEFRSSCGWARCGNPEDVLREATFQLHLGVGDNGPLLGRHRVQPAQHRGGQDAGRPCAADLLRYKCPGRDSNPQEPTPIGSRAPLRPCDRATWPGRDSGGSRCRCSRPAPSAHPASPGRSPWS
jgi:SPP1 gp7 family putative phage head morphogenesis protein